MMFIMSYISSFESSKDSLTLTDFAVVLRQHSNIADVNLASVPIVEQDLHHVVLARHVQVFHRGREETVVGLAPENADPGSVGQLVLCLRLDVQNLNLKIDLEHSS